MRSIRRLLLIGATIASLAMVAPIATASDGKAFHLAKVCDEAGCVVTESNYSRIPAGTTITYAGSSDDALVATIHVKHGTATGVCNLVPVFSGTGDGTCVFTTGTGRLGSFRADLAVSTVDFTTWYWDGTVTPADHD